MSLKAGYKGPVYIGDVKVAGLVTWTYSGETRNMHDIDELDPTEDYIKQKALRKVGGDIAGNGNYLVDSDPGQKLLKTYFDNGANCDLRLYTDYDNGIYQRVKSGGEIIITNVNNIGVDASGVGSFSFTGHVNGELEQVGSSTVVSVATVGSIDETFGSGDNCSVTLWGKLLSFGEETEDIDCYFEYGLSDSYGSDTSGSSTPMDAVGNFDNDISGLADATEYHYRAVALLADTSKKYGKDMTVTVS